MKRKTVFSVKANEELFNKWKFIENPFTELKKIVQNDGEITPQQLEEWVSNFVGLRDRFSKKLDKLYSETVAYIRSCVTK